MDKQVFFSFIPHDSILTLEYSSTTLYKQLWPRDFLWSWQFKSSSKIKSYLLFEVGFLPLYARKERNLSEFNVSELVR